MPKSKLHTSTSSLLLALLASIGFAVDAQQATTPGTPQTGTQRLPATRSAPQTTASDSRELASIDAQIAAMRNIEDRLHQASTPQERQALLPEHWRIMQQARETLRRNEMSGSGLAMEGKMGPGKGMGPSTGTLGGPAAPSATPGAPAMDPAQREAWNQRRLDMMQATMEMMMDYLPSTPPTTSAPASPATR